ncbi:DUF7577 domain-containing protein [Halocatena marina]|uniref:DUF7577 domain-containing protein n=1 Tax=Halocatena marina TaxID=2934937 RepID=UPI004039FF85
MDASDPILAILFVFFRINDDENSNASTTLTPRFESTFPLDKHSRGTDTLAPIVCRRCGMENDAEYTYCKNCFTELRSY